jgi:hypothetical protein
MRDRTHPTSKRSRGQAPPLGFRRGATPRARSGRVEWRRKSRQGPRDPYSKLPLRKGGSYRRDSSRALPIPQPGTRAAGGPSPHRPLSWGEGGSFRPRVAGPCSGLRAARTRAPLEATGPCRRRSDSRPRALFTMSKSERRRGASSPGFTRCRGGRARGGPDDGANCTAARVGGEEGRGRNRRRFGGCVNGG